MTIAVSTATALPTPTLPGQQGNASGDVFALLMNVGTPQADASADAAVQQPVSDIVATPEAPLAAATATSPPEDSAILVKAASALVSSLMPEKDTQSETAAKPVAVATTQVPALRIDGRTRETAAPEKKEGRAKAKNSGDEAPHTPDSPEGALPAILIALPAVGDTPEVTPAPEAKPEPATDAVTAAPAKTDRAASLPHPVKNLPAISVEGRRVATVMTSANPNPATKESAAAVDLPAVQINAVASLPTRPIDAEVENEAVPAQPVIASTPAEARKAEAAIAVEIPAASKSAKPAAPLTVAKASEPQKPLPGTEKQAVTIDTIITPAPVHASRVAPADAPIVQPAPVAAAPSDMLVDRQLDLVRNEQWLGELARDIADSSGDNQKLNFKLMPPQLGRLDVDLSRSHHGLSLTIRTETDSAQAILTAAQPRLVEEMRAQGVKLADTQMFSGDMRQSSNQSGQAQPAPALIEAFIPHTETEEAAHETVRDGRYA